MNIHIASAPTIQTSNTRTHAVNFGLVLILALLIVFGNVSHPVMAAGCSAEDGQALIDAGQYENAVLAFSCVIASDPTGVEGYRGRAEASLLLGEFSDAMQDYARLMAVVLPEDPNAENTIMAGYAARLSADPNSIPALTGKSFASWWFFHYGQAIQALNKLLDIQPDNVYANLFRGSSRLLLGAAVAKGKSDLEQAIALDPNSPDVRFIVADAYTYGQPDPQRAFSEASFALNGGLNTPRVHAILASAYTVFGDQISAAGHIKTHIDLVTAEFVQTNPIAPGETDMLELVPYRTFDIPVPANSGETISISTSSKDFYDTIMVLLAPDGTPVVGSDDANFYFAEIDWVATQSGTYRLLVTSFEGVSTGEVVVTSD